MKFEHWRGFPGVFGLESLLVLGFLELPIRYNLVKGAQKRTFTTGAIAVR